MAASVSSTCRRSAGLRGSRFGLCRASDGEDRAWGETKATHEGAMTGGSSSESKQTESEREEGELGVRSTSLTGSSGSLSESEGIP